MQGVKISGTILQFMKHITVKDKEDHKKHEVDVHGVNLKSLKRESVVREEYIVRIKRYLTSESTQAPKRMEPNSA